MLSPAQGSAFLARRRVGDADDIVLHVLPQVLLGGFLCRLLLLPPHLLNQQAHHLGLPRTWIRAVRKMDGVRDDGPAILRLGSCPTDPRGQVLETAKPEANLFLRAKTVLL